MRQQVEHWLNHESVKLTLSRLSWLFESWLLFYIERIVFLMKTIVFNSIQVINYWFTLHRTLRLLYQQAQTFSFNIQGISDQNVTLTLNRLSQFFEGQPSFYIERIVSLMEMIVFNSIQVINYWFILHCALRSLYQQAQMFSLNIQGISNQNVILWTFLQYKNDNQCTEVSFSKSSQPSRPSANDQCTQDINTQCIHRWEREAVSLLDQAWVIYWIQSGKVQVWDEQRPVYCIVPQRCSI